MNMWAQRDANEVLSESSTCVFADGIQDVRVSSLIKENYTEWRTKNRPAVS
jgi:hypothetical protein